MPIDPRRGFGGLKRLSKPTTNASVMLCGLGAADSGIETEKLVVCLSYLVCGIESGQV
jgi:hypothetical protein